jgi:hypothetical protein
MHTLEEVFRQARSSFKWYLRVNHHQSAQPPYHWPIEVNDQLKKHPCLENQSPFSLRTGKRHNHSWWNILSASYRVRAIYRFLRRFDHRVPLLYFTAETIPLDDLLLSLELLSGSVIQSKHRNNIQWNLYSSSNHTRWKISVRINSNVQRFFHANYLGICVHSNYLITFRGEAGTIWNLNDHHWCAKQSETRSRHVLRWSEWQRLRAHGRSPKKRSHCLLHFDRIGNIDTTAVSMVSLNILTWTVRCYPLMTSESTQPMSPVLLIPAVSPPTIILSRLYRIREGNGVWWRYDGLVLSPKSSLSILPGALQVDRTYQFRVVMENRQNTSEQIFGHVLVRVEPKHRPTIFIG